MRCDVRGYGLVLRDRWREVICQRIGGDVERPPRDNWDGDPQDCCRSNISPERETVEGERGEDRERTHRLDEVVPREVATGQRPRHRDDEPYDRQADGDGQSAPPGG